MTPTRVVRYAAGVLLLAAGYTLAGQLSLLLSLHALGSPLPLMWMPSAISLAVVVLCGLRWCPGVALGAFTSAFVHGFSALGAFGVAAVDVGEVVAAVLLLRSVRFRAELERVRDVIALMSVTVAVSMVGAACSAMIVVVNGRLPAEPFQQVWSWWWWSHFSSDLVLVPVILTLVCRRTPLPIRPRTMLEGLLLGAAALGIVLLVLAGHVPLPATNAPHYLVPILIWAGLRFGPRGAALASFGAISCALAAQALGLGPFERAFDLQSFIALSTLSTLVLSALVMERMRALDRIGALRLASLDPVVTIDLQGAIVDVNPAAEHLFGLRERESIGRNVASLLWPRGFAPRFQERLREYAQSDAVKRGVRFRTKAMHAVTGEPIAVEVSVLPMFEERPAVFTGFIRDIRAEVDVRARLVQLVASSQDAIIGLSPSGEIETWNAAATALFGYRPAEVLGRTCDMLVPEGERGHLEARLTTVRSGAHLAHYELPHVRRDGTVFDASVTMSAVLDPDRQIVGVSKVVRDVTSQRAAEEQVRASLREKEVLLREIHHRVKNNLQVIASLLNLQVAADESAQSQKWLVESQTRIHSMALVHQLLYQSEDLAAVDFGDYLRKVTSRLTDTYDVDRSRIAIEVASVPLKLDIDHAVPGGLLVNELVTNALTHAFPAGRKGRIKVALDRDDANVVLTVTDDGIGIPEGVRLGNTQTFGLRIARTLAAQLHGSLTLMADHGTRAVVVFPTVIKASRDSSRELRSFAHGTA